MPGTPYLRVGEPSSSSSFIKRRRRKSINISNVPDLPKVPKLGPSTGLLSLLASIAGLPSAEGNYIEATPPPFLAPFLDQNTASAATRTSVPEHRSKRSLPTDDSVRRHYVPDKYEQGDDGRWRRADSYSLYGATVCKNNCDPDAVTGSPAYQTPAPSVVENINLPSGWQVTNKPTTTRTTIIVTLSLVLACLICVMMIGCVLWRKRIAKRKEKDLEKKLQRRKLKEEEAEREKEQKVKAKFWARATARWKDGAHLRLRGRRRRYAQGSSDSLRERGATSRPQSPALSIPQAPPLSRRTSSSSISISEPLPPPEETPHTEEAPPLEEPSRRMSVESITSPPAYNHQRRTVASSSSSSNPLRAPDSKDRSYSLEPSFPPNSEPSAYTIPYTPPLDDAHVATDDKGLLERMANMASAPPTTANEADLGEGQSNPAPLAPVWEDEELDEAIHLSRSETGRVTNSSIFPPPPSPRKGKMKYFDYPNELEEVGLGSDAEPSAPPFEEHETLAAAPSAPPLFEEEVLEASAPALEAELGQDHDREGSSSAMDNAAGPSAPPLDPTPPVY